MTGHIHDKFIVFGDEFHLIEQKGNDLFDPFSYNMITYVNNSANSRGFYCEYELTDTELLLQNLYINTNHPVQLNGIDAKESKDRHFKFQYQNINLKINYTGILILAKDLPPSNYMGFQEIMAYNKIVHVILSEGNIENMMNISEKVIKLCQKRLYYDELEPFNPMDKSEQNCDWIIKAFSLEYDKDIFEYEGFIY